MVEEIKIRDCVQNILFKGILEKEGISKNEIVGEPPLMRMILFSFPLMDPTNNTVDFALGSLPKQETIVRTLRFIFDKK